MKNALIASVVLAALGTGEALAQEYVDDGTQAVPTYDAFYDALAPYGAWFDSPIYGRVWQPSPLVVGQDFRPYATAGRWLDTEWGWYFDSEFDWGWAPFHYGRWAFDDGLGWLWVPDYTWGPAWVDWRVNDEQIAWLPLLPRGVAVSWIVYAPRWCVVDRGWFGEPGVGFHLAPPASTIPRGRAVPPPAPPTGPVRPRDNWHGYPPPRGNTGLVRNPSFAVPGQPGATPRGGRGRGSSNPVGEPSVGSAPPTSPGGWSGGGGNGSGGRAMPAAHSGNATTGASGPARTYAPVAGSGAPAGGHAPSSAAPSASPSGTVHAQGHGVRGGR